MPRLRLVTPWQLAVTALLLAILFTLIFPRRALLESLHRQERFDNLTLAYIDNLRRVATGDEELTILVVRARLSETPFADSEQALLPIITGHDTRLRLLASRTLAAAALHEMRRLLAGYRGEDEIWAQLVLRYDQIRDMGDDRQWKEASPLWVEALLRTPRVRVNANPELRNRVRAFLAETSQMELSGSDRLGIVALAMHAGLIDEAFRFLSGFGDEEVIRALRRAAESALGHGHYDTAGMLYLQARERASSLAEARECFRLGIASYMAGGLYSAAMDASNRYLGNLDEDRETLRFLVRTALAAGAPQRAADYARRLVFRSPEDGRPQ